MELCNFSTRELVQYLRKELPAPQMRAIATAIALSEVDHDIIEGIELAIKNKGFCLNDDLDVIMDALERIERDHTQMVMNVLAQFKEEQKLNDEIDELLEKLEQDASEESLNKFSNYSSFHPPFSFGKVPVSVEKEKSFPQSYYIILWNIDAVKKSLLGEIEELIAQSTEKIAGLIEARFSAKRPNQVKKKRGKRIRQKQLLKNKNLMFPFRETAETCNSSFEAG